MKKIHVKNWLLPLLYISFFLSCAQKKTTISAAISIKKDSTTIVIKDSTGIKPIYINGSLDSFLRKISTIDSPITGIKIYFIKTNGNAPASKTFQYINCEDTTIFSTGSFISVSFWEGLWQEKKNEQAMIAAA